MWKQASRADQLRVYEPRSFDSLAAFPQPTHRLPKNHEGRLPSARPIATNFLTCKHKLSYKISFLRAELKGQQQGRTQRSTEPKDQQQRRAFDALLRQLGVTSEASPREKGLAMPDVKINEGQWKELPDEAKKRIEELINTSFKPKHRIRVIPDAKTPRANLSGPSLVRCGEACMAAETAALQACEKLSTGEEVTACKLIAWEAYRNCIRA